MVCAPKELLYLYHILCYNAIKTLITLKFSMEPLFSLRDVLQATLRCKLMKDSEIQTWEACIDVLDDRHLQELWSMFSAEHTDLSSAVKSLDDYLLYFHACDTRRHTWLQKIENDDSGVVGMVTSILQSKRHWISVQIDEAFTSDDSVALFLAGLSIRDLEQVRKIVDLHEQAGEYDDDDGKPTNARDTLIGIVSFLQEDVWEREKVEANAFLSILQSAPVLTGDPVLDAKALGDLGITLRKGLLDLGHTHTGKAAEKVLAWTEHQPSWFTMTWEQAKAALESAALTVNISGTLAGLGAVASHLLQGGLALRLEDLGKRI